MSTFELWIAAFAVGSKMKGDGLGRFLFVSQILEIVEISHDLDLVMKDRYLLSLPLSWSMASIDGLLGSLWAPGCNVISVVLY